MSTQGRLFAKNTLLAATLVVIACVAACFGTSTAYAENRVPLVTGMASSTVTTVPGYGDTATNTTGTANIRTVYRFGWISGGNNNAKQGVRKNLDVTGDGYADTIKVTGTKTSSNSGYLKKVKVTVNGKTAVSYSNSTNKINRAIVSVVTLKNKQPFLWVDILDGKGNGFQRMYKYESGSFDKMFSNGTMKRSNTSDQIITSISPENNKINVTFSLATTVTGITRLKYTYSYEDGVLERTSNTTTKLSYVTKDDGTYTTNKIKAAGTFKAYKTTSLKTKAFTVKTGKTFKPVAARLQGKKLLYKISYGGKTGWIACPKIKKKTSKAPATLSYDTYGKVSLTKSIPTYSKYKRFTASQLQKYNNHALYVARNEICARHGYSFTNGELRNRFMHKSWYSRIRTAMNPVEVDNLNLILSIERNRESQYAV